MNKGIIIGGALAIVPVSSCAVGGAVLATKMESNNNTPVQSNVKVTAEEVKEGWVKDKNSWYYLGDNGKMRTGWIKNKYQWYHLNTDGTMATNTTVDGCYLNSNGLIEDTPTKAKQSNRVSDDNSNNNSNVTYKTYTNKRFLFSFDYPSNLQFMGRGANGGGADFKSADGRLELGASGMNNAIFQTVEYYYNQSLEYEKVTPSYSHLGKNYYTLSWEKDGKITYEYFILGKKSFNRFGFTYPASEKDYFKPVVERIYSSFKTPGIDSSH
ncbi:hypothetical protein [Clostridium saccharoperbutylacetonicum]